ncbi:PepSY-associated TM helix domain-containing protein [Psychrobacter sp. APC 3350]|uniref:PepSY-associated TM helix domain-containing protein n=1 Tax=Psychrobacter sp. APC 3350 TaxID=3035195 RepID=UPI0025B2CA83|nr:PepSY-associated TM helix domain-containing protein [Psychrobacter sp. APC 3350]MDN3453304.1 PepSY-associated TM helix domain-containing protein [Psychrobacter sp. APC 3350]
MISFKPRQACLWIHRYTGLAMAAFLIVASITGILLAFHHELDDIFNRKLANIEAQSTPLLSIAELHNKVITTYPEHQFSSMPTSITPDKSVVFSVDRNRGGDDNQPKPLFQDVYVNPYTSDIIGTRDKDAWAWHNTMWKVFWLHRDLLLGDIGKWILGIVSLIWTINCFIGFYLTFPRVVKSNKTKPAAHKKRASFFKRWRPAWKIRRKTNTFKLNYDLHHAFGLWLWVMLFVIAWSSVGFNLPQVYRPVMQAVVGLASIEGRPVVKLEPNKAMAQKNGADSTIKGKHVGVSDDANNEIIKAQAVNKANSIAYLSEQAHIAAQSKGMTVRELLGIRWVDADQQWQMRFKTDRDIGKKGGASSITIDAATGNIERVNFGYQSASFGSKTDQWLSTLHMGHISQGIGHVLYQIFLVLVGLAVAVLSGTGVYLWWKGRQQRLKALQKDRL